ncbi:MAG: DUF4835 family protein [Weeksellaceae bacterium]|nr:DUF4835 family protein [Weeksellaceae bacterium]
MKKLIYIFLFIVGQNLTYSQEIIANVQVDFTNVRGSSNVAYEALQSSLNDFINTTRWTEKTYKMHERIEANITLIIQERISNNQFRAHLLIQSRRPIFNTNYHSPILNINDTSFTFDYTEYEQLIFNQRRFSNKNLTDAIGFYIYLILGYDADTFERNGGTEYFRIAQNIANNAQNAPFDGWSSVSGPRTRTGLINDLLNPKNSTLRTAYYNYHRMGLDMMTQNELQAKNSIANTILTLENYQRTNNYAQNYPLDIFMQTKKNEIGNIFSGGVRTTAQLTKMKDMLNTIASVHSAEWNRISQ